MISDIEYCAMLARASGDKDSAEKLDELAMLQSSHRKCPTCGHYSPAGQPLTCCPGRSAEALQLQVLDAHLRVAAHSSGFADTTGLLHEASGKIREAIRILEARAGSV